MRWLPDDAVARLREVADVPDLTGTRYEIVRELGRGGMGVVYEARDVELQRNVALKVVSSELQGSSGIHLEGEARVIARLEHPGIVPLYDAGVLPDGRIYYTMKVVRGLDLSRWTAQGHARSERLRLFTRICEPLAFAHARGIVHRDLKPSNVMIGEFGAVLVMDWGVAAEQSAERTIIVGTPGFMPPEQLAGGAVTPAADVFALGALLRTLFGDEPVPRALEAVAAKAMHQDPHARYRDAGELGNDVQRFLDGEPVTAYRESPVERALRWSRRNQVLLALVAAYLLMRAIVFFWMRL